MAKLSFRKNNELKFSFSTNDMSNIVFDINPSNTNIKYSLNDGEIKDLVGNTLQAPDDFKLHYYLSRENCYPYDNSFIISGSSVVSYNMQWHMKTVTFINIPEDAVVKYSIDDGEEQTLVGDTIEVRAEGMLTYSVSKEHYVTRIETVQIMEDTSVPCDLEPEQYDITFDITPEGTTVKYSVNDGEEQTLVGNVLTVTYLDKVAYNLSKEHYVGYSDTINSVEQDMTVSHSLSLVQHTLTFDITPSDAHIKYAINDGLYQDLVGTTITADYNSEISYVISREDYIPVENRITLVEDTTVTETLILTTYKLTLNTNVNNCNVVFTFDGQDHEPTSYTDNSYSITTQYKGDITYTVSKDDYVTVTDTVSKLVQDTNISVDLVHVAHDLTLNTNVEDCTVVFNYAGQDHEPTSSTDKSYTLNTNYRGGITYTVSKEHYITVTGNIESLTEDMSFDITLIEKEHLLTLNTNVEDCNVVFKIDNIDYEPTSHTSTSYSISVKEDKTVTYTVSKEEYITITDSVTIVDEDVSVDVELELQPYNLTLITNVDNCEVVFHVDGEDLEPTSHTDNTYTLSTTYREEVGYTVSKENYITVEDSVESLTEDTEVEIEMILANHDITFDITPSDVTIRYTINDGLFRPLSGNVLTAPHNSKVRYIISKEDYVEVDETIDSLTDDMTVTKTLVLTTYNLTLNTNVEDCNIVFTFDGEDHAPTSSTDKSYTLTTQYKGQITYTVSKEGYITVTDTVAKLVQDTNIDVELTPASHTLTLNTNVDDCSVVFHVNEEDLAPTSSTSNSYSLTTGWTGEIGYTVSKTDYITVEDSIDSLEEDKSVNITLEVDTRIQQVYDASGNLVNIDDLDIITKDQFFYACDYNNNLSGELKPFPTTEIESKGLLWAFSDCLNLTGSVSFPNLTSVGSEGLNNAFSYCEEITSVSFPNLTSIDFRGLYTAFCYTNITGSVSFPALTSVGSYGLEDAFEECTNLTEVHFKTSMSGNKQCTASNMGCPNATIYFDLP